jgi:hypothetical protein
MWMKLEFQVESRIGVCCCKEGMNSLMHTMCLSLFVYVELGRSNNHGPIALVPTSSCESMCIWLIVTMPTSSHESMHV